MIDKNTAMIDYLLQCADIKNSTLYFNLVNAKDNTLQILTVAEDKMLNRPYIDGSVLKRVTYNLIAFKSISDMALVKLEGYSNENIDELQDVQKLIDWISEQEELSNYPDFGNECMIESIDTSTETPNFNGIDNAVTPPLAMYSIQIVVQYIDTSKQIWK